ncbi:hypothetical protein ABPG75_000417 [Micractinium tetrahymenae]
MSGLPPSVGAARLRSLVESAGGTVRNLSINRGDARGDMCFATLASAQQAALVVERLQGVQLEGCRLFMRESKSEVRTAWNLLSRQERRALQADLAAASAGGAPTGPTA